MTATARLGRLAPRVLLIGGVAVFAIYIGLWLGLIVTGGAVAADYTAFYTGWTIVLQGNGAQLYDPPTQAAVQQEVLGGRTFEAGLNPFNNPPHLVLPFVPLALLPLEISYLVWGVVQVALLGWLMWRLLTTIAADWTRPQRMVLIGAALALPSLVLTLLQGAFSLLIAVAVLELYLALVASRDTRAGVWLFIGSLKPQAVAGFGVMLLAGQRWRALATTIALGLVSVAITTLVLGAGIWSSYLSFLGEYVSTFDELSVRPSVMWNLRGTMAIWLGPDITPSEAALINDVALFLQIAGLVAIGVLWFRHWAPETAAFRLRFAATILIGMLTTPHLNPHDGLLLIPAAALAYDATRGTSLGRWVGILAAVTPFLVLVLNPLSVNEEGGPPIRAPVLAMLALLALVLGGLAGLGLGRPSQSTARTATAP